MPANPANLQRIFSSPAEITKRVDEALVKGLTKQFPIESRNYRVEVSNVRPEHTEVTNADEKEAILRSKSLTYPIKADVKLIDKNTGIVVDESKGCLLYTSPSPRDS